MKFSELEINDFLGLTPSNPKGPINSAEDIENIELRGDNSLGLKLRNGIYNRHTAPVHESHLSNIGLLGYETLSASELPLNVQGLHENINILLQKGTLTTVNPAQTSFSVNAINFNVGNPALATTMTIGTIENLGPLSMGELITFKEVTGEGVPEYLNGKSFKDYDIVSGTSLSISFLAGTFSSDAEYSGGGIMTVNEKPPDVVVPLISLRKKFDPNAEPSACWLDQWDILTKYCLSTIYDIPNEGTNHKGAICLNFISENLDIYNGFTVYNITRDNYSKVIDSGFYGTYHKCLIGTFAENNDWERGDIILLMSYYIPYSMIDNFNLAKLENTSFCKVLNDIKITFGSEDGFYALSLGYRENYYSIATAQAKQVNGSDYTEAQLKAVSKVKGFILTPVIEERGAYSIDIDSHTPGDVLAGSYKFMMTAVLDGFQEFCVAEATHELAEDSALFVKPMIKLGRENRRITSVNFYIDKDGSGYYLNSSFSITDKEYNKKYGIDALGNLVADTIAVTGDGSIQYNSVPNATTVENIASLGGNDANGIFVGFSDGVLDNNGAGINYVSSLNNVRGYIVFTNRNMPGKTRYNISFKAWVVDGEVTDNVVFVRFRLESGGIDIVHSETVIVKVGSTIPATATKIVIYADAKPEYLVFDLRPNGYLKIDELSIKEEFTSVFVVNDLEKSIVSKLGYSPTFNYVKTYDKALLIGGRQYFLNPVADIKYDNKIFLSHISGAGALMYDVATTELNLDLENFSGNNIIGMELLRDVNLFIAKKDSVSIVDAFTGKTYYVYQGKGAIAKRSIINIGDTIIWAGYKGIFATNGLKVEQINKDIEGLYSADKNTFAYKDDFENTYCFIVGNKVYQYTPKGWQIVKYYVTGGISPLSYALDEYSRVNFVDASGAIWTISEANFNDTDDNFNFKWVSKEFDIEKIGGQIKRNEFLRLQRIWIKTNPLAQVTLSLYVDGVATAYDTINTASETGVYNYGEKLFSRLLKRGGVTCRKFKLAVEGTSPLDSTLSIKSIGVLWKTIPSGIY